MRSLNYTTIDEFTAYVGGFTQANKDAQHTDNPYNHTTTRHLREAWLEGFRACTHNQPQMIVNQWLTNASKVL